MLQSLVLISWDRSLTILTDLETSRKETKVRPRGHELRQAHHSSAKAKEVRIRTSFSFFHVQQVRAAIEHISDIYHIASTTRESTQFSDTNDDIRKGPHALDDVREQTPTTATGSFVNIKRKREKRIRRDFPPSSPSPCEIPATLNCFERSACFPFFLLSSGTVLLLFCYLKGLVFSFSHFHLSLIIVLSFLFLSFFHCVFFVPFIFPLVVPDSF